MLKVAHIIHRNGLLPTFPPELLGRALHYLYHKEARSSFEIEHIKPSASRTGNFIGLLKTAEQKEFGEKPLLIDLQNRIVDPRFQDRDDRTNQNYVGQIIARQRQIVHYVCPKPDDLPELMSGLLAAHRAVKEGGPSPPWFTPRPSLAGSSSSIPLRMATAGFSGS